jgi:Putative Actinobacterial Holin-X, holin superfamily III
MEQDTANGARTDETAGTRSLIDDLRQLAQDGRTFAEAEFAYQRSRAAFAGGEARVLAGLGIGALFFLFFALMALTMGMLMGLAGEVGPWLATLIVVSVLSVLGLICALTAKSRAARLVRLLKDDRP